MNLHELILEAVEDLNAAASQGDWRRVYHVIGDGNLALAYVLAKELDLHGYEAFQALVDETRAGVPE